ncbi:hypothetical protein G911_03989 [Escherichia coli UMEA 3121-1]|nr:hypothetical protein G905_03961 [Escherichia coli UMEA 3087-1]EQW75718.1 hypothetical protein G911_03989 [Escherichia coli UMEA 3121-1]EQY39184.1 hypothetical protein G949_04029 [Escherichia coli UMEA 3222-1]
MLGGADNPNGELPSYITGADTDGNTGRWASNHHGSSLHYGRIISVLRLMLVWCLDSQALEGRFDYRE